MMEVGVRGKYLAIHEVAKIMVPQKVGLIVNISAGASKINYYHPLFRMAMAAVDRLTEATAFDLKDTGVSCLSIWPRWVRTEWMLMANDNSDLGIEVSETDLGESDSPEFTGRAIAHLAADPKVKARSGEIIPVVALAHEYGFDDLDGTRPPMDEFTQDWSGRLKQLRAITTR
jgi:NAD(P)-dependent dehydrogenase (short-subunit alcohol dehydrogenase family)